MSCRNMLPVFICMFLFTAVAIGESKGAFTANVINAAGSQNDRTNIYDKLAIVSYEHQKYVNDIWMQTKYENFSLGNGFDDDIGGLSFGYGKEILKNALLGFFGNYNSHSVAQDKSGADINSYGIGAYGGYLYKEFDFKGILSFSGQQYSTSRDTGTNGKAKADFNGYGINADLEAAMWFELIPLINLRPYVGLNLGYTGYGSSDEKGAGTMNLDTDSGSFTKTAMRFGAGLNGKYQRFGWFGGLECELLFSGQYAEIESSLAGSSNKVKSKGEETGSAVLGINAGGDYDISHQFKAYMNLNYKVSGSLGDFTANLGIAYIFNTF